MTVLSTPTIDRRQIDFLYWHGVSKMRMGDFDGAGRVFKLLQAAQPERSDAALGFAYCLVRQGQWEQAARTVAGLRRRPLRPEELGLLGRLHRRCEFERSRQAAKHKAAAQRQPTSPGGGSLPVAPDGTAGRSGEAAA